MRIVTIGELTDKQRDRHVRFYNMSHNSNAADYYGTYNKITHVSVTHIILSPFLLGWMESHYLCTLSVITFAKLRWHLVILV